MFHPVEDNGMVEARLSEIEARLTEVEGRLGRLDLREPTRRAGGLDRALAKLQRAVAADSEKVSTKV